MASAGQRLTAIDADFAEARDAQPRKEQPPHCVKRIFAEAAARLANYAGGRVVMKRGTATVSAQELRDAVKRDRK